jgi:hypothetical protein
MPKIKESSIRAAAALAVVETKTLEARLCLRLGVSDQFLVDDPDYGETIVSLARRRGSVSLHETIGEYFALDGRSHKHIGNNLFDAIPKGKEGHVQAKGFSTINLPGILGNVANKVLLDAFTNVDSTVDLIAEAADFQNFYPHQVYRLDHLGDFQPVPPTGELKHGHLSQSNYSNQLATFGQIIGLSRLDIINDDLNAFRSVTQTLGRKARLAVEKALYTQVMEASDSFYTIPRGNRLVGGLGLTELAAAEAALMQMVDANGDPIFATPKVLLVPAALKTFALGIYQSEMLQGSTTSTAGQPATNIYRGRFDVVSSPYLANPTMAGSSGSTWYLMADPNLLPAFQVAYLDGRRAPTVETADAEFSTLGLSMRCYFDFGCSRIDYRAIVKTTAT